jgi:hypothetical protein
MNDSCVVLYAQKTLCAKEHSGGNYPKALTSARWVGDNRFRSTVLIKEVFEDHGRLENFQPCSYVA